MRILLPHPSMIQGIMEYHIHLFFHALNFCGKFDEFDPFLNSFHKMNQISKKFRI